MSENMSDKWVDYAVRIQSIAQAGLAYCEDKYGRERYEELRKISAEMISAKTGCREYRKRGAGGNGAFGTLQKADCRAGLEEA